MFRSRDDFKPQAISRIIMVCVRAVYERPVKVCGTHVSFRVVYDPPCAQDAVLFAWVSRLSFRVRRESLPHCTDAGLSLSRLSTTLSRQHSGVSPSPQSALGSPQSAEVGVGRRPRRRSLFYTQLCYTDYSIGFVTVRIRDTVHVHTAFYASLFKHGLRISLHEIHT